MREIFGAAKLILSKEACYLLKTIRMKISLHILKHDNLKDYSSGKRIRFAVVDSERASKYPSNFVCMLPLRVSTDGKAPSVFVKLFGEKSLETAKKLLHEALKKEQDSEIKVEIERRIKLLEPQPMNVKKCRGCGKLFEVHSKRGFRHRFCPECERKKYGQRE